MVTRASMLAFWLLRRAAGRWPAGIRAELLREWTAEVQTIARDRSLRAPRRCWLLLAFGTSLALARPGGDPAYTPLGWKRIAGVVGAVSAYLMILALLQRGWSSVFGYVAEGERPIIDDSGLPARLVLAAAALAPVVVAGGAGWLLGRVFGRSRRVVRPVSLGLCLIAVVAAWVGAGFAAERSRVFPGPIPVPPTMSYDFGRQPYGMVTSWMAWLISFAVLAGLVRWAAARRRAIWRIPAAAGVAVTSPGWRSPPARSCSSDRPRLRAARRGNGSRSGWCRRGHSRHRSMKRGTASTRPQ